MIVIGDEVLQNGSIVCLSAGSAHWHMTLAQQQSFPDAAAPFSGFRFFLLRFEMDIDGHLLRNSWVDQCHSETDYCIGMPCNWHVF